MLTITEDIVLLSLNEQLGDVVPIPRWSLACTMAGATLMDLAEANRIDTDLEHLMVMDATPVGNDILDPVLAEVAQADEPHDTRFWITRLAAQGEEIRNKTLARLMAGGILEVEESGLVSFAPGVAQARRYPRSDTRGREEVRLRVMRVLFDADIPDPHDGQVISLAQACHIFEHLLSPEEFKTISSRLATVSQLDLIGRAVAEAVQQGEPAPDTRPRPPQDIPVAPLPLTLKRSKLFRYWFAQQYEKLGPIFRITLGKWALVVMVGPEANRFFTKHDRTHFRSQEFWSGVGNALGMSHTTLGMVGEDHTRMRRVKRHGYSCAMGEMQIPDIVAVVRREIDSWSPGRPFPGTTASKRLVYNLTSRIVAGIDAPEYFEDLTYWFDQTMKFAVLRRDGWYAKRKLKKARYATTRKRLDELAAKIIEAHDPEKRRNRPPDLIDDLLADHHSDPVFLSEVDLKAEVLEPLWIPIDTTGHVMAFLLYILLKHQDLQQRVRAEADELFANGLPTVEGIRRLDVTRRVMLETMRLYMPISGHSRTVTNSFEFDGRKVPAGTQVLIAGGASHFLPECFPEPHRFDIERFAPPRNEHQQSGAFCPYGLGTHRCLGAALAEFLMMTAMATIFHDVELRLEPPTYTLTQRKIDRSVSPRPKKSFKFRLVRKRALGSS